MYDINITNHQKDFLFVKVYSVIREIKILKS